MYRYLYYFCSNQRKSYMNMKRKGNQVIMDDSDLTKIVKLASKTAATTTVELMLDEQAKKNTISVVKAIMEKQNCGLSTANKIARVMPGVFGKHPQKISLFDFNRYYDLQKQ